MDKLDKELQVLLPAIKEAGERVLNLRTQNLVVTQKANHDLLTEADLQADAILKKHLLTAFPDDGWLSEETVDNEARLACKRVWIVDPIDGTKEYVHGLPEYAVSVALVEEGKPIVSAVFNPATNQLFYAVKHQGAYLDNQKIMCDSSSKSMLVSRSEYERGEWTNFKSEYDLKPTGSIAFKLALVAKGAAAIALTPNPRSEWDIAAGVLLVQEAGGTVTNNMNQDFIFNQRNVIVNGVFASYAGCQLERRT